jgi:non-specific serine/threonine protein kinase
MLPGDLYAFGEWVRRRRKALDLTQTQLAQCTGCAAITIRRIESDSLRPSTQIAARLADCLAIPPDERDLFLQTARAQRPADQLPSPLAGAASASVAAKTRRDNLPLQLTSFVGRTRELAALAALLETDRLVTLTGVGGVGKTRLALQLARSFEPACADGVWLVELAPLHDAYFVAPTVARALDVREQADQPLLATLVSCLHDKQLVLIMDNCEHLSSACAELIDVLLHSCPALRILATSREPLNLLGEQLYPLMPLATPSIQPAYSPAALLASESARLFCERARAVQPTFAPTETNAREIAEVCQRLDGLPLAIELAAVHVRRGSLQLLLNCLNEPLALLVDGPRNLPQRQQTLRTAIDWSYQLLEPSEQRLFARLGVFAGGWTIEAAQAVGYDAAPESSVAAVLGALLDKSLIRLADSDAAAPRFVMLETIQSYARERLASSGALELARWRHAEYYLALVRQAEEHLTGAQSSVWIERFDQDHENLRDALSWALEHGDQVERRRDLALRLCSVLWDFWYARGYLSEGRRWLAGVLGASAGAVSAARARALHGAGVLARTQGDIPAALALLDESLALSKALHDQPGVARSLNSLGVLAFNQSDYDRAQAYFEESLCVHRALDDQRRVAVTLNNLGNIAYKKGETQRATELYEASLTLLRGPFAHPPTIALVKSNLAEVARVHKEYRRAIRLLYESAAIYRELNGSEGVMLCLSNLVEIAIDQGQPVLAAGLLGAIDALYEQIGAVRSPEVARDYEREMTAAQAQLDAATFAKAWRQGRSTPIEQMFAQALDRIQSDSSFS